MKNLTNPSIQRQNLNLLLISATFLGASLSLYGYWETRHLWGIPLLSRYPGLIEWLGYAVLSVAITSLWPELTLVILGGGPNRSAFLWPLLGMPFRGLLFAGFVIVLWITASLILVRRGLFRINKPNLDWPLAFVGVMCIWTLSYTASGYTWLAGSEILDKYVILGLLRTLVMWYLVFSQSADVVRSGKRLLWAVLLVNVSGVMANALMKTGSLISLFDPSSAIWEFNPTEPRVSFEGYNPVGVAVEIFAPGLIVSFIFLLSPKFHGLLKMIFAGLVVVMGIFIVGTGTRQAVIGVIMVMLVMAFVRRGRPSYHSLLVLLLMIGIVQAVFTLGEQFVAVSSQRFYALISIAENLESYSRFLSLERDIVAFLENPLLGKGLGFGSVNSPMRTLVFLVSHNMLASIAAEVGVIPLVITLGFLLAVLRSIWRLVRLEGLSAEKQVVVHGLIGLFIFEVMTSMVAGSGRMEGGYTFFGVGTALYFLAKSLTDGRS